MKVGLFAEDEGHRGLITGVIRRVATDLRVDVDLIERTAMGGKAQVLRSLRDYVRDLVHGREPFIEILVVALDSDCDAAGKRRDALRAADGFAGKIVLAIPEPHVERWFLLDPQAPARALGEGGAAALPDMKCEPNRYKQALRAAFAGMGVDPPAGGVLYGEEIADTMNLELACRHADFSAFLGDLRGALRLVRREQSNL